MPAPRKVSARQMELLVEFAESHRDVALGRFPGGPQAARAAREMWASIAGRLNSVAEGTNKTPEQWRRYWIEFKAKTKAKAADSRRNAIATGGGPNKLVPLSDIEGRVLAIVGKVAVEGLPGVRLPIELQSLDETRLVASGSAVENIPEPSPQPIPSEPAMEVEWLDEEIATPQPETHSISPTPIVFPIESAMQPSVSRDNRPTQQSDSPVQPEQRSRSWRRVRRDERVPRWAYDIEMRRIAAEERRATAMESLIGLIREIRDDVRSYVHQRNNL